MNDLFDILDNQKKINGLVFKPDFLSLDEINTIINDIDEAEWSTELSRRVQHYGYKYDYRSKYIDDSMKVAELPVWAKEIARKLFLEGSFSKEPDQVIINEYMPGQGISPHIDCVPCFGDVVASISFLSPCMMTFSSLKNEGSIDYDLSPGSAIIFSGEARYQWKHGIVGRRFDKINGINRPRHRRISATFRTVLT